MSNHSQQDKWKPLTIQQEHYLQPPQKSQYLLPPPPHRGQSQDKQMLRQHQKRYIDPPHINTNYRELGSPNSYSSNHDSHDGNPLSASTGSYQPSEPASRENRRHAKRQRVTQACDNCNRKKIKCDGVFPMCTHCSSIGKECTYVRVTKKRGPKAGFIEELEARVRELESRLDGETYSNIIVVPADSSSEYTDRLDDIDMSDSSSIRASHHSESGNTQFFKCNSSSPNHASANAYLKPHGHDFIRPSRSPTSKRSPSPLRQNMSIYSTGPPSIISTNRSVSPLPSYYKQLNASPISATLAPPSFAYGSDGSHSPLVGNACEIRHKLIQLYFRYVHSFIPVLHKRKFIDTIGYEIPLLMNSVYSIAACYAHPDSSFSWKPFYTTAKQSIEKSLATPSISVIVGFLILSYHAVFVEKQNEAWVYMGIAIQMAQRLGLSSESNSDSSADSVYVNEYRRRIWWTLYETDLLMGIFYKLSPSICRSKFNVQLPSGVWPQANSKNGNQSCLNSSLEKHKRPADHAKPLHDMGSIRNMNIDAFNSGIVYKGSIQTLYIDLLEITIQLALLDQSEMTMRISGSYRHGQPSTLKKDLDIRLSKWMQNAPVCMKSVCSKYILSFDDKLDSPPSWKMAFIQILYHYSVIMPCESAIAEEIESSKQYSSLPPFSMEGLYPQTTTHSDHKDFVVLRRCTQSAFIITAIVECALIQNPEFEQFSPFVYNCMKCAGMTLLQSLRLCCDRAHVGNVMRSVEAVFSGLRNLARFNKSVHVAIAELSDRMRVISPYCNDMLE
ncbi:hypothetical protein BDEG_21761 [Batrachochytrium dendrobatidis JEL423]|uniref:Zn(2)-C6 fungal-type domain-containing protein n=1 Tax=Batrachochytrium dendrobatidis (strain JEL423) TaxID=403673 RepID=A0A177WCG0_BATDL|nr:hypothetical protein BDEG_21761 [Batrachochytrium dendrobatidis JEL423]